MKNTFDWYEYSLYGLLHYGKYQFFIRSEIFCNWRVFIVQIIFYVCNGKYLISSLLLLGNYFTWWILENSSASTSGTWTAWIGALLCYLACVWLGKIFYRMNRTSWNLFSLINLIEDRVVISYQFFQKLNFISGKLFVRKVFQQIFWNLELIVC
jgi:hypothetical protein